MPFVYFTQQEYLDFSSHHAPQCSKIGKKCNFKSTKTHFLQFQKWQKINFCTRKKFKITKNAIFGLKKKKKPRIFGSFKLFFGAKIDFLPLLRLQKMCSCENHIVQKQLVFRMNSSYFFKACFLPTQRMTKMILKNPPKAIP